MTTPKCVGCPFRSDCPGCPWTGEIPAAATESAPVSGVASGILMGPHKEAAPAGNRGLVPPKPLSLTEGRAAMIGAQTPTRTPIEPTRPGVANA